MATLENSYQSQAYDVLREMIIDTTLKPGTKITEKELVDKMGLGRTPIREAIIRLKREGILEVKPQSATLISKINMQTVLEARFVREVIEKAIFLEAIENVDDLAVVDLKKYISLQKIYAESNDFKNFFNLDETFHAKIYDLAGKKHVWGWLQNMNLQFNRFRFLSLEISRDNIERLIPQHTAILEALKSKNKAKLEQLIYEHLHVIFDDENPVKTAFPEYFD